MFFNKKDKEKNENVENQKYKSSSFSGAVDLMKNIFKKREYKVEKREITKEDKKAVLYTFIIIVGLALILWFLPFTHQFIEDFIFLRF